jgi:hypothetical protein
MSRYWLVILYQTAIPLPDLLNSFVTNSSSCHGIVHVCLIIIRNDSDKIIPGNNIFAF